MKMEKREEWGKKNMRVKKTRDISKKSILIIFLLAITWNIIAIISSASPNVVQPPDEKIGSGLNKYYDPETNEIIDYTQKLVRESVNPTKKIEDLNSNNMKQATNLKDKWDDIPDETRTDFLKDNPNKVSELSAEQLTRSDKLRDLITDPNQKVWEQITQDPQKSIDVLKEMGYKVNTNSNLQGWKWDKAGELKILKYDENGPKIFMDLTNQYQITFQGAKTTLTLLSDPTNVLTYSGDFKWEPINSFAEPGPRSAPSASSGSDGGGSSSGGGGGSGGIEEAFQQAISLAQQASQLLSGLAESLKSNGKGKTTTSENGQGGLTTTLYDGAAIALTDEEKEKLLAMQNDPNNPAVIQTEKNNEVQITNADIIVPEQLAAEVDEETTLTMNGIDGNDPSNPPLDSSKRYRALFLS